MKFSGIQIRILEEFKGFSSMGIGAVEGNSYGIY